MNYKPIVMGAIVGAASAAKIDYSSFRSWKSFRDAYTYDWGTAAWRWLQGAVIGAVGVSGLTALIP